MQILRFFNRIFPMRRKPVVCGVDEVGRGPLAGPVTAAAVVLMHTFPFHLLGDSKTLNSDRRESLCRTILQQSPAYSLGWVWPEEIDHLNIHNASLLAMKRAVESLSLTPDRALVDGKFLPDISIPCEAIIRGDTKEFTIMAASILAKVARDKWMVRHSWIDNRYGFEKHKGYPTKEHRAKIEKYGISGIHRRSFRISPVL